MCLQPITELPAGSGCYLPSPAQPYTALPSAGKLRKPGKCWWEKLAEVPVKHTAKSPLRTSTELKKKKSWKKKIWQSHSYSPPPPPAFNLFKFRPKVYLTRVKKKKNRKGCWSYYKRLMSRGSCCADTTQLQACCSLAVSTAAPEANAAPLISLRILSCGVKEVWSNHSLSQNLSLKKDLKNCANVPKGRGVSSNEHCYKRCCGENLLGVCYLLPDFIFTLILPY